MNDRFAVFVDTAFVGLGLALFKQTAGSWTVVDKVYSPEPQAATKFISLYVKNLFQKHQLVWEHSDRMIINAGPGSFTGIKIGLSFLNGVLQALPALTAAPIHSLVALSKLDKSPTLWFLPATATQGYVAGYGLPDLSPHAFACAFDEGFLSIRASEQSGFQGKFALLPNTQCVIIGRWPKWEAILAAQAITPTFLAPDQAFERQVIAVHAALTAQTLSFSHDLPAPLFLRRSAPEEKLLSQPLKERTHDDGHP